ncbi:cation diffusion facilitator family transporter [Pseudoneobacillus rhizosphaerae]|nr:cation diffusion facilitator family transporter [Pseudoneobacillus rhizosphaerae]
MKVVIGLWAGSEEIKGRWSKQCNRHCCFYSCINRIKVCPKPADKNHPYGHWKAETVASMVASFIMAAVGIQVVYQAVHKSIIGEYQSPDLISAWVGIFAAVVMYFVYRFNRNLAREIKSQSVMAAAKDNLSDALVSIGTVIRIIGAQLGLPWLDPVAAVIGFNNM